MVLAFFLPVLNLLPRQTLMVHTVNADNNDQAMGYRKKQELSNNSPEIFFVTDRLKFYREVLTTKL